MGSIFSTPKKILPKKILPKKILPKKNIIYWHDNTNEYISNCNEKENIKKIIKLLGI